MIHYEVNLDIDHTVYADFMTWLPEHIQEVLAIAGFITATISEETDQPQKMTVIYELNSIEDLQNYLDHHAGAMREKTIQRFGEKIKAWRRVRRLTSTLVR